MKTAAFLLVLALASESAFSLSSLSSGPYSGSVPQRSVQGYSSNNPTNGQSGQQQERRPITPFVAPANANGYLGYYSPPGPASSRNPPNASTQQNYRPPANPQLNNSGPRENANYMRNQYAPSAATQRTNPGNAYPYQNAPAEPALPLNNYGNRRNQPPPFRTHEQPPHNYGNSRDQPPFRNRENNVLTWHGKQYERYRPNSGYNSYNGYHYQDDYGSPRRFNEYNNPFNNLYYRNNYNQFNGYNNVDFSGGMYYYDHNAGRQYRNVRHNKQMEQRNKNNEGNNYSEPKYLVNRVTGEQHPNPAHGNDQMSYYYQGKPRNTQQRNKSSERNNYSEPKYLVNRTTGEQHPNPAYGNDQMSYYYQGQNRHTQRHQAFDGTMGRF